MKRLGKWTGTIYPDNYNFDNCPECCTCITDKDANNESFINAKHAIDTIECAQCRGCPASQN